jgi:hypothetical protein
LSTVAAGAGCDGLEQAGERAGGHAGPDVACVAGALKEVRVDIECDRDARVAEDAADLGYVEPEVDDQVGGEDVAQVVEAKRRPHVVVQPGKLGGARQDAPADVAVAVGSATGGREHPVLASREPAALPVCAKQAGELDDERDVADRGGGLRRDPPGWAAAVGARELRAHVDHAGGEVDVVPDEAEHLRDAQAGRERSRSSADRAVSRSRAGAAEDALAAAPWPRALVVVEPLDGVDDDPTAPAGEAAARSGASRARSPRSSASGR